ncbi:MAG: type VI secretion system baseplate subunit TssE [Holosporaceae bacterium]|jgi:type VI secretion system lysozyme-like protein|nr:type VI secretion system baseplate subunit TssE [Holosporaceae bacterium]
MSDVAITSLFEKLIDENADESFEKTPKRFATFAEFQDSIAQDLTRLLNSKVATAWRKNPITTPYAYGAIVTAPAAAEDVFEIQELQSRIDDAIRKFEPRLINAKSTFVGVGNDSSVAFVTIDATVNLENRKAPLSFPITIDL